MKTDLVRSVNWYLEGFVADSPTRQFIPINRWPFRIGRAPQLSLHLLYAGVSKEHAEIWHDGKSLWIRDLDSRNGTFVNGKRVEREIPIKEGDVLHFANVEFRLGCRAISNAGATMEQDPSEWVWTLAEFEKLFNTGVAVPFFQKIVALRDETTFGYEVLARSQLVGLKSPQQMFSVAARLSMVAELSRLFREEGVRVGQSLAGTPNLFLNTHPEELGEAALFASLVALRHGAPEQALTLEIHEAAVTNPKAMRELRSALTDLNIQLAYDDFGAGQARLIDLIEVPPDYLKFDICLIRDIHLGSDARRQMLETLVRMAHDLGVAVLAEGVESRCEGDVCTALGFDYAQGYHYGKPAGIEHGESAAVDSTATVGPITAR